MDDLHDFLDTRFLLPDDGKAVFRDHGHIVLPINRWGLTRLGKQKFYSMERNIIVIHIAQISVIQDDGSIISSVEDIYGECGAVEFNYLKCRNLVLKSNIHICPVSHVPVCLRHRKHLGNGLIVNSTLSKYKLLAIKAGLLNGQNGKNTLDNMARVPRISGAIGPGEQPSN